MRFRLLLLALLLPAPAPCAAGMCSCRIPPVEQALAGAEVAFTGVPVDGAVLSEHGADVLSTQEPLVLRVTRRFKGTLGDTIILRDGGACAVGFRLGTEYVVYATRGVDGVLHTSFCHRSRRLADAAEDLRELDAIARP